MALIRPRCCPYEAAGALEQLQQKMREQAGLLARGRGRPRPPIDPLRVMELALLGLDNKDIAARLPCNRTTLSCFAPELARAWARRQALMKLGDFHAAVHGEGEALRRLLQAGKMVTSVLEVYAVLLIRRSTWPC